MKGLSRQCRAVPFACDESRTKPACYIRLWMSSTVERPLFPAIDALRGVSILLVVVHHLALRIPLRKAALADVAPLRLLNAVSYNGYEAVVVFFVASGFLIAHHALERRGGLSDLDVRAFYVRRFSRIAPCLLLLLLVLSALHVLEVREYAIDVSRQSLPRALTAALLLHLNWYEAKTGYLPGAWDVLWSLSIEEVFYLAFPWICRALRRPGVLLVTTAVFAASLPYWHATANWNEIWQEKAYLPGFAAIATGVATALLVRRWRVPRRLAPWLLSIGAAGILCVLGWEDVLWRWLKDGTLLVLTTSTALFLIAATRFPSTRRAFPGGLRSWGRLTYEIYLTHMFVVFALVRAFKSSGAELRTGYGWYAPLLLLTWAFGWCVSRYFSVPMERWLRSRLLDAPGS